LCFLFKGGKWEAARDGIGRALQEMSGKLMRKFQPRRRRKNGGSHG